MSDQSTHLLVIGGGIAGLAAAWDLAADHDVTVVEASDRVGGKLIGTMPLLASWLSEPFDPSPYAPVSREVFGEIFAHLEGGDERLGAEAIVVTAFASRELCTRASCLGDTAVVGIDCVHVDHGTN